MSFLKLWSCLFNHTFKLLRGLDASLDEPLLRVEELFDVGDGLGCSSIFLRDVADSLEQLLGIVVHTRHYALQRQDLHAVPQRGVVDNLVHPPVFLLDLVVLQLELVDDLLERLDLRVRVMQVVLVSPELLRVQLQVLVFALADQRSQLAENHREW